MFAGRPVVGGGGRGVRFTVEDLYGISRKPKPPPGMGRTGRFWLNPSSRDRSPVLASPLLEGAPWLVERRRLEAFLRECCLSLADCAAERTAMPYR